MILLIFFLQIEEEGKISKIEVDKDIIFPLINALKMLKDIITNHNKTFRDYLDIRSELTMNRLLYQQKKFNKIAKDINSLMKQVVNKADFESYLENSNKILNSYQ